MHIFDIINMITDISIYYYSKFRCDQNFVYDNDTYDFMKNKILYLYHNNHNVDLDNIFGVTIFDSILPYTYQYIFDNNNIDFDILKKKIINIIQTCIDDKFIIINHDYSIISIDTCPFDCIGITHDFIVNTLDIYFYKMR